MEIKAPGPTGPLSGTLWGPPDLGAPVVLIVPGSGPTDRDGNSPLGIRASTYRLVAKGLAARGIRSVCIDKRGLFGSARAISDANAVTIQDYAADIRTWAVTIRQETGAPCVWVLGHSEGGLAALLAAQQPFGLCGLLLVSTAGRPLGAVLREQIKATFSSAPLRERAETILARLEIGRRSTSEDISPPLLPLFRPEVQSFLSSVLALDQSWPRPIAARC
ncbi:MAG: alpha/beta hydrolase [Janthinobacterium lividum]